MDQDKVLILGGGVSGLIAAIELEKVGEECLIVEKNAEIGGRVSTEIIEGIPFDKGFQVLLTAYPEARNYLNYEELNLIQFKPGAVITKNRNHTRIGDPLRDSSALWSTIFSSAGTIGDKIKIFQLSRALKKKSVEEIFKSKSIETIEYLKNLNFSNKIISNFFIPFFSGIFLEKELETSSKMFEFLFKMFSEGHAAIPIKGMSAIPNQLASNLKRTEVLTSTEVENIKNGEVTLSNGEKINPKAIIQTFSDVNNDLTWKKCNTLYYEVDKNIVKAPIIALIAKKDSLINSYHFMDDIFPGLDRHILSVTVVNQKNMSDEEIQTNVENEIKILLQITPSRLIKHYSIPFSLPNVEEPKLNNNCEITTIENIPMIKTGDYINFGSLNAAMSAGAQAAKQLIEHLN